MAYDSLPPGYTIVDPTQHETPPPMAAPTPSTPLPQGYTLSPETTRLMNPPVISNEGAASNTRTGLSRGLGSLLDAASQAELAEQAAPPEVTPKPGEVGQAATNYALGGQKAYQPETPLGRIYQNVLADTVASAPMAALGPGGVVPFLTRQAMNLTGNIGGELGRNAFPNHPIIGGLIGSLVGGGIPNAAQAVTTAGRNMVGRALGTEGAVERQAARSFAAQPANNMPMSSVDSILAQGNGAYWTPGRLAAATEYQKRGAVGNMNPTLATGPEPTDTLTQQIIQHGLGGLGLAAGNWVSHNLGYPGWLEGIGLGAGEIAGAKLKPWLQNRAAQINTRAQDFLNNNQADLWLQYQRQQQAPGLAGYLSGIAAPMIQQAQ